MDDYILRMEKISKTFGENVKALEAVSLNAKRGEVHALLGENGAGKSTLMKILSGAYRQDSGRIFIDGREVSFHNTRDATHGGVGIVFQELNLVSTLTAVENAFLGRLETNRFGMVDWKRLREKFLHFMKSIDFEINPDIPVSDLSIADKQMVEIAKALLLKSKILIMDEPTATLTSEEIKKLFVIIGDLKKSGVTIIYISHKLEEVFQICDRVTVLRDGRYISTQEVADTNKAKLIEQMVGRSVDVEFPPRECCAGDTVLEIGGLFTPGFLSDISFNLRRGEILGIAGLVGSGRTEIARAIFGADKIEKGSFKLNGHTVKIASTMDAKRFSIGLLPEDRKDEGLAVDYSVARNISITNLNKISNHIWLNRKKELAESEKLVKRLSIKTPSVNQKLSNLSGGNQQKVVLAKWLFNDADILILDEPTRGIDVGAKYEIYLLMNELVKQGKAIIMISSELPEIFALSDRILVMYEGRMRACLDNGEGLKPEEVMRFALG
ncbi:MAG: sugar ABC transporter ATP-binding protein [Treponema sp.]|jgi:ABC-type sugar transport system ATPase subunit|nr:sugar ABC transporter ATP-binding protein [Treponema sp.]